MSFCVFEFQALFCFREVDMKWHGQQDVTYLVLHIIKGIFWLYDIEGKVMLSFKITFNWIYFYFLKKDIYIFVFVTYTFIHILLLR